MPSGGNVIRKIAIVSLALMVMSLGILSGCTQQSGTENNENEEKHSEFVDWQNDTLTWLITMEKQINDSVAEHNWNDSLYYCKQVENKLDIYINMGRDFYLEGTLDSARNQYIEFLQLDKNAYGEFNIAFQDWGGGWIEVGNEHAQSAIKIMDQALQYLEKCYQYISDWKNE